MPEEKTVNVDVKKDTTSIVNEVQNEQADELNLVSQTAKLFVKVFEKLEKNYQTRSTWGYKTGFADYDNLTKGLHNSELTVVAARHSMGKSSFVLNIATNLAEQEIPVLYVSYDLDKENVATRLISSLAEIDSAKIKESVLKSQEWERAISALNKIISLSEDNLLHIEPNCYLYYKDLFDLIRKFKEDHNKGVVIVDYFQLVKLYKQEDTRIIELSSLAAAFKHLAMEIEMPLILVSQVNKKCEERVDKRPLLSDLAECDALAQHSDNMVFIFREEYYYNNDDDYEKITCNKGEAEIILAKQKNGPKGKIKLFYQSSICKFKNPIRSDIF